MADVAAPPGVDGFRRALLFLPGRLAPASAAVVSLLALTSRTSAADVGLYGLAYASAMLAAVVASGWIEQSVLRFYAAHERDGRLTHLQRAHWGAIALVMGALVLVGAVSAGVASWLGGPSPPLLVAATALAVATVAFSNIQVYQVARGWAGKYSAMEIARAVAVAGGLVAIATANRLTSQSLLWVWTAGTLASAIAFARPWSLAVRVDEPSEVRRFLAASSRFGVPLLAWFAGSQLLFLTDRYVLALFHPIDLVGVYHANYQLFPAALGLLFAPLLLAAHPLILRRADLQGREAGLAEAGHMAGRFLLISVPAAVLVALVAPAISAVLLPAEFVVDALLIGIMVATAVGWNLGLYAHKGMEIAQRTSGMFVLVAACALLNAALNVALVPRFGMIGSALATSVAAWAYPGILFLRRGPNRVPFPWRHGAVAAVMAAVGSLAFLGSAQVFRLRLTSLMAAGALAGIFLAAAVAVALPFWRRTPNVTEAPP